MTKYISLPPPPPDPHHGFALTDYDVWPNDVINPLGRRVRDTVEFIVQYYEISKQDSQKIVSDIVRDILLEMGY